MWKVVPISKGQLLDVRPEDVLNGGLFRKCSTYRGGGGYDKFPLICEKRLGKKYSEQFLVQLFGCNLDCPYCYITRAGVWGEPVEQTTDQLIDAFIASQQQTFHLMGGAPAIYIDKWSELIARLKERCPEAVFHSDILLTERIYKPEWLWNINQVGKDNNLFAVDVKGLTDEEHMTNTRKPFLKQRFWSNLMAIAEARLNFYFTFTNVKQENIAVFWEQVERSLGKDFVSMHKADAFSIDLIEYDALPYVDDVPWGVQK